MQTARSHDPMRESALLLALSLTTFATDICIEIPQHYQCLWRYAELLSFA
jgi:hypothetical protein